MTSIRIDPPTEDSAGQLTVVVAPASAWDVGRQVGEPGPSQVRLHPDVPPPERTIMAFVNSAFQSLFLPRNPIGALVLVQLGAGRYVYAGPVVFTGWSHGEPDEICDLAEADEAMIRGLWEAALDGAPPALTRYADWVRNEPFRGHGAIPFDDTATPIGGA